MRKTKKNWANELQSDQYDLNHPSDRSVLLWDIMVIEAPVWTKLIFAPFSLISSGRLWPIYGELVGRRYIDPVLKELGFGPMKSFGLKHPDLLSDRDKAEQPFKTPTDNQRELEANNTSKLNHFLEVTTKLKQALDKAQAINVDLEKFSREVAEVKRQVSLGGILTNEDLKTTVMMETACQEIDFSIEVGDLEERMNQTQEIFNEIVIRIKNTNRRLKRALKSEASERLGVVKDQIKAHAQ